MSEPINKVYKVPKLNIPKVKEPTKFYKLNTSREVARIQAVG